jgi:hypothetical protein
LPAKAVLFKVESFRRSIPRGGLLLSRVGLVSEYTDTPHMNTRFTFFWKALTFSAAMASSALVCA